MEYPQYYYRLVFTTLKPRENKFKMYYLFPRTAEGLAAMKYEAKEHERLANSSLYETIGFKDVSFFVTMQKYKLVKEGFGMSDEITHYRIK